MNLSSIAFLVLLGLALFVAGFVGVAVNECQLFQSRKARRYIRDYLVLLVLMDCVLILLVLWALPLWAPTWLR